MQYDDYIILVDENGRPYIAHGERYQAFKNALRNSRPVKYIEKFPNFYGMGKTAYAYTEEAARYMRNIGRSAGRKVKGAANKAAKFVDDHDAGLTERIQSRSYSRQAKRAAKRGNHDEFNDLATQAAKYAKQSREEYKNSAVGKTAKKISSMLNKNDGTKRSTSNDGSNRPASHERNITGLAKEGWSKRRESDTVSTRTKYGEYSKNDPDFADSNYNKAKHIGNSDFLTFQRDDGRWVILEEDMKWVLPEGVKGNDPQITRAVNNFVNKVAIARADGKPFTGDEWLNTFTDAIDDASRKVKNK